MNDAMGNLIVDPLNHRNSFDPRFAVAFAITDLHTREFLTPIFSKYNMVFDCSRDFDLCLPILYANRFFFRIIDYPIYSKIEGEIERYYSITDEMRTPTVVVCLDDSRILEHPMILDMRKVPSEEIARQYRESKDRMIKIW